jgi:hypothetical protein
MYANHALRLVAFQAAAILVLAMAANASGQTAKPEWLGSTAGISDEVLAPWTPVVAAGSRVEVWGRRYTLGALTLPVEIVARDCRLLSRPITLAGTAGGKPIVWQGSGRLAQSQPSRARLVGKAQSGLLQCEAIAEIEYDGMLRCDLRLRPVAGRVDVERLVLEVPLVAQHAKYLHTWPGHWGTAGNSAALPADGFRGPFKPFVWLGDEWRGLAWFAESDRNFTLAAKQSALEIVRGAGSVTLRINLIGTRKTLDGPLDYTFGFQATPVKPAVPDAWDCRICHNGAYGMESRPSPVPGQGKTLLDFMAMRGVRTICFHEHWTDIQNYPATTHGEQLRKLVAACHQHGMQLLLYHGYELSNIAPEWDAWHEQCLVAPRAGGYRRKPDQIDYIVCYRSPWQDFLAHGLKRLIDEYHIDGVYLDGTSEPWACANLRHGCGYRKAGGSVGATYPIFSTRSMMRRIYTIVRAHRPDGQVNVHQSTCMTTPTLAFATSYWDGEQLQSVKRAANAQDVLPMDAFCAEFMGHNYGVPAELLWYSSGPFTRTEAVAMGLLHDVPVRPVLTAEIETSGRIWRVFDEFGRKQAQWLPYWENAKYVQTTPADARVSLYNRPGKGLVAVVVNTGRQAANVELSFDLKALAQPGPLTAHNVMTDRPVELRAGRVKMQLAPLDFALLRVQAEN